MGALKGFGLWLQEYKPDDRPIEMNMERFIDYTKSVDVIGKTAVLAQKQAGARHPLATMVLDATHADVNADEPIGKGDTLLGFVTSGGYAHWARGSVVIGFLSPDKIQADTVVDIEILGEKQPHMSLLNACTTQRIYC